MRKPGKESREPNLKRFSVYGSHCLRGIYPAHCHNRSEADRGTMMLNALKSLSPIRATWGGGNRYWRHAVDERSDGAALKDLNC